MKQYSIIHVPFMSFFSKALYRDVCLNWKGVGFGYLLLLLIICWIPPMTKFHAGMSDFFENEAPPIISQVPTITFGDGQVSIDEPEPYYITDPESGDTLCIIDTTGTITSLENTSAMALLTKTQLISKKNEYQTQTYDLSQFGDMVIDQEKINGWISAIKSWATPVLSCFAIIGSYIFRIIQALIYGAVGLVFANLCKSKISYGASIRLAVVAVTPVIIVRTILYISGLTVPFLGLLCFLVAMGYLYFGVKACAADSSEQATEVLNGLSNAPYAPPLHEENDRFGM